MSEPLDTSKTVAAPPSMFAGCSAGALMIVETLQGAGFTAYLAGGCVRDLLMGRTPKDFDICTNALPPDVQRLFNRSIAVGKAFGVVLVTVGGEQFDVATFRIDSNYKDGRRPVAVTFADARNDALRRDLTINALFYDPRSGMIIDYVDGLRDLDSRVVRTVGKAADRFAEDHLRLMRAVRFSTSLDFALDPDTERAIIANAAHLIRISQDRIRDEFILTLTGTSRPGDAIVMLDNLQLLNVFLPEITALKAQEQPADFHPEGNVFRHTVKMLNLLDHPDARLALAVLFHDIGKPLVAKTIDGRIRFHYHAERGAELAATVCRRLRMSTADSDLICHIVRNHSRMTDAREMKRSTLRRLIGTPAFELELELHRLDRLASTGDLSTHEYLLATMAELRAEPVLPTAWITGHDIIALGITEGPRVGFWRNRAYDYQLEGRFSDRESLLRWLELEVTRDQQS